MSLSFLIKPWASWKAPLSLHSDLASVSPLFVLVFANDINVEIKSMLASVEAWVQSMDEEVPLEKEMSTHSSFLSWRIPWTEEPGGGGATVFGVTNNRTQLKE